MTDVDREGNRSSGSKLIARSKAEMFSSQTNTPMFWEHFRVHLAQNLCTCLPTERFHSEAMILLGTALLDAAGRRLSL